MTTTSTPEIQTPATGVDPAADAVLDAYRRWGYLHAALDPLGRLRPLDNPDLPASGAGVEQAQRWYCGSLAAEFMHIPDPVRRRFVAERMERAGETPNRNRILERLLRADLFEQFIQQRYLGSKRFSMEGVTALVPLLDEVLETSAAHGLEQAVLAMSHRGRLNVMLQIVGKPAVEILAGFEDVDPKSTLGGGDVKYHLGATGAFRAGNGRSVNLHLVSNPSHLEAVNPVAAGRVRAKQRRLERQDGDAAARVLPIVLHGDAAFAGQGIVAETLNLMSIRGYDVGGTIQVVVNNLIGFTTNFPALHSSRFSSDVAKRLPVPIFHVNGEDPDAVVRAARIAAEYRATFHTDVVIDLIGYRRHGHSEVDDPTITQPLLYARLKSVPPLWKSYAERIGASPDAVEAMTAALHQEFGEAQRQASQLAKIPVLRQLPSYWDRYRGGPWTAGVEVDTGLSAETLRSLGEGLVRYPDGFHIHPKVKKLLEQRLEMARGEKPLDYGFAEALAFGSLVTAGTPVRLSGQDSRRGTFNHRHSVLIDIENENEHVPLQHLAAGQARFESYDSVLSEAAVLGFEYGYSRDYPETLVLWEAQFGDFANGAEIILDQFIAASEDKWNLLSGVVMLLPHGYEGQGPEHSSARLERYLQLAAEDNIQVCQPSSAAQHFHMLRRQALRSWRKPLVVFTPKSMLRHADAMSPLAELSRPRFHTVVPDAEVRDAQRVLLCTGKIGHELLAERKRRGDTRTAVLFLDQLYPFPEADLAAALDAYPNAREVVWVQEEPANMGALFFVLPRIELVARGKGVRSVKRSASASPATGSPKAHAMEQKALLQLAFA
jgi:2-oxoglutarate dehydrogenase E1 component